MASGDVPRADLDHEVSSVSTNASLSRASTSRSTRSSQSDNQAPNKHAHIKRFPGFTTAPLFQRTTLHDRKRKQHIFRPGPDSVNSCLHWLARLDVGQECGFDGKETAPGQKRWAKGKERRGFWVSFFRFLFNLFLLEDMVSRFPYTLSCRYLCIMNLFHLFIHSFTPGF